MNHEHIKKTIQDILTLIGVAYESITSSEVEGRTAFVIKSPESHLLIGGRGIHLSALNHIIKRITAKTEAQEGALDFYVDVNDYHERLMQEIKNKATILAGRARSFKTNIEMEPMSSYERMIVHSFFQETADIKTESVGTGSGRHIVLKYVEPEAKESF